MAGRRGLFRPSVLIALALSVSTLAALVAFGDPWQVAALIRSLQPAWLLLAASALACYEALRAMQWFFLLRALGVRATLRRRVLAFLLGEMMRNAPGGALMQGYVLSRAGVGSFARASAATLTILLTEIGVALAGALLLDVRGWPWLRPVVAGFLAGTIAALGVVTWAAATNGGLSRHRPGAGRRMAQPALLRKLLAFAAEAGALARPGVLAVNVLLGAAGLLAAGLALQAVLRGLGAAVAVRQTLGAYLLSVAVYLLVPLPLDVGGPEVAGTGALIAAGVDKSTAVSAMVVSRLLGLLITSASALAGAIALRGELRTVLRAESPRDGLAAGTT